MECCDNDSCKGVGEINKIFIANEPIKDGESYDDYLERLRSGEIQLTELKIDESDKPKTEGEFYPTFYVKW